MSNEKRDPSGSTDFDEGLHSTERAATTRAPSLGGAEAELTISAPAPLVNRLILQMLDAELTLAVPSPVSSSHVPSPVSSPISSPISSPPVSTVDPERTIARPSPRMEVEATLRSAQAPLGDVEPTLHGARSPSVRPGMDIDRTLPGEILKLDFDELTRGIVPPLASETSDIRRVPAASRAVLTAMRTRLAAHDYTAALEFADTLLAETPDDLEAKECKLRCEMALEDVYGSHIGALTQVPRLAISVQEVRALSLDTRAGFLLSRIDGVSSFETILDSSGMSNLEALRALFTLLQERIITLA